MIEFCVIVSLFITGLFTAMNGDDMVLVPVANWLSTRVKYEWVRKPLYECLVCMSSFWTVVFAIGYSLDISSAGAFSLWLLETLLCVFIVAGMMVIVSVILKPLSDG